MPTFLYIKTHNITGLKYFGKTTKTDPHKYTGSGKYWKRHLKVHGNFYSTEIVATFNDVEECEKFALDFSNRHNIVESVEWANLQEENGITGAPKGHAGHKFTDEQLMKISESAKQRWQDHDYKNKVVESQSAAWTNERKRKHSERLSGVKRPEHSAKMRGRKLDSQHPFFNEHKTTEHKLNISKTLVGKTKSEEHKQKLKKSIQTRTEEDWKRILENRRSKSKSKFEIDGVSYVSLNQASQELGITPFHVKKLITRHL